MENADAIVVHDLRKSFKQVKVLDGIDFSVKKGTILALLGPNGAGKTTTIRILSTLLKPDSGQVFVNGYDVVKQSDHVRGAIGLTGQYAAVDEYLTGEENLEMIGRLYRLRKADIKNRSRELLAQFGLDTANRPVKTYSGGMRRKLDLAMSLIASPPIIFLDEPTTGLDPHSRLTMWRIIKELAAKGITIVLTTQYMDEADQLADRIMVIDKGKVIAQGTANELKQKVGSERLELTLAKGSDLNVAKKALQGKTVTIDDEGNTISMVSKGGVKELKQVLRRLDVAKVKVESLSLHRPTLDDVFLLLTGHAATMDTEKNEGEK